MMSQIRVLHLSDLHICYPLQLRRRIEHAMRAIQERIGERLDVEYATEDDLRNLELAINELDPDVVCITGDITTFGDRSSFDRAATLIGRIRTRTARNHREVVVTPGNHDVLCSQLASLLKLAGVRAVLARLAMAGALTELKSLLRDAAVEPSPQDPLRNFNGFVAKAQVNQNHVVVSKEKNAVTIVPFGSVSLDPLWMNQGSAGQKDFTRFATALRTAERRGPLLALLHHNPMSSPDVMEARLTHAYNSMVGASMYVREMQRVGVDVILYGHQHSFACCLIDYVPDQPGHLYLSGAPSATTGAERGFNLLEISDRYHGSLTGYSVSPTGAHVVSPSHPTAIPLIFETERAPDRVTLSVHREIRRYYQERGDSDGGTWDELYSCASGDPVQDLLVFGPRMQVVRDQRLPDLERIVRLPTCASVRILLSDPRLFEPIGRLEQADREFLSKMWGADYTWETQSRIASEVLSALKAFRDSADPSVRTKMEIRVAPTLLPIGGVARNISASTGVIQLRMLPVGVMDGVWRSVLRLEYRHEQAVFSFYRAYLNKLYDVATVV